MPVPGRDGARVNVPAVRGGVVDLDAGLAKHGDRHRDMRRGRQGLTDVLHRQAVGERCSGQQQPGDELRRRRGVDLHRPAGDRSGAAHPERQAVAVDVDAQTAQRIQQRHDRADPGLLVTVERDGSQAQRRQRWDERNTVPARPQSTRASGGGSIVPLTASSSAGPSIRRPSASSAPIIRSVSRLRSAPLMVETPPVAAASAASTNARLVWDFEPGTVTVASTGREVEGAGRYSRAPSLPTGQHGDMCGRFAVTTDPAVLAEKIEAIDEARAAESTGPNYDVAPTTTITTVVRRHQEPDDEPTRRVRSMRWGLIPPWVKAGSDGAPESKGPLLINARAEKVTASPAFRASAKSKRCLIPMDGYYEWRANGDTDSGKKARKTPFFLHRADGEMLFMAGLWSVWKPAKDAAPLLSCTIITTDAVGGLAQSTTGCR